MILVNHESVDANSERSTIFFLPFERVNESNILPEILLELFNLIAHVILFHH